MNLQAWWGEQPQSAFVEQSYYRQPQSGRCSDEQQLALGSWSTIEQILADETADVMIVRSNERYTGETPRTLASAQALVAEGYTLLVRHAERQHPGIRQLAEAFRHDFGAPVDVHLYVTPPKSYGFSWHYDAEEVFILQTAGRKEYSLRKNTVNPWPIEETLPHDMQYEREIMPLMQCTLAPGDWLYIPSGWWHRAVAQTDDTAISLAVGVMARTGVDVFKAMRERVVNSMLWRQRMPVLGAASPLDAAQQEAEVRQVLKMLADDAAKILTSNAFVADVLAQFR